MKRLSDRPSRGEGGGLPAWVGYLVVVVFLLVLGFAGWIEGMS